jgi:alpha-N-acetylglucosaminidase
MLSLFLVLAMAAALPPHPAPVHDPVAAAQGLVTRLLGSQYLASFAFTTEPPDAASGNDVFSLSAGIAGGAPVAISGTTGVSLASGLGWYLKYTLNCSWGWGYSNSGHNFLPALSLGPSQLPPPATPGRFVAQARFRYSWNTCTFGYSFPWYTTREWQEEIDRAALWGINAPLMPIGLEAAEAAVYTRLGMTQAELQAWFTGHSHLPWQRMANIKKLAGPLPPASWAAQAALGEAVSAAMTQFGMTPVLPGFAGHVPDALRRLYPSANISQSSDWGGVGCNYSCAALLEPSDPLFGTLGAALNEEVLGRYGRGVGASPMFNADTFNEEIPESGAPDYLYQWNEAVFKAMTAAAPAPIFVLQAWAFHNSFWTQERVRAYLAPVPLRSMLILDLNSEDGPVWQNFESFFGHWWSWCGLIVFGGRRGVYGNLPVLGTSVYSARANSTSLVGLGITPEAIDQCSAAFDLTLEAAWRPSPTTNASAWLQGWAARRYPTAAASAQAGGLTAAAYAILSDAAYRAGGPDLSIYEKTPSLSAAMSSGTNVTGMLAALRLLLAAAQPALDPMGALAASTTLHYDALDLAREVACALHSDLSRLASARFLAPPPPPLPPQTQTQNATPAAGAAAAAAAAAAAVGLSPVNTTAALASLLNASAALLAGADAMLGSDGNFRLGGWSEAARARGVEAGAEALFVRDAQLLVSLWTEDGAAFGGLINDYSSRNGWSGLVGGYYAPRWAIFGRWLLRAAAAGSAVLNATGFQADLAAFEAAWVGDTSRVHPPLPPPNAPSPLQAVRAFLDAWAPEEGSGGAPWASQWTLVRNASLVYLGPPGPSPPPPVVGNWVFLGANKAAVGEDCPFVLQDNTLGSLGACQGACAEDARCNFVNYDAGEDWCVFRSCRSPLQAALSPNQGYSAYAYNSTGKRPSGPVAVRALLRAPGAMAAVCGADPLCVGFDSSGLMVEGNWSTQFSLGGTAYLRVQQP